MDQQDSKRDRILDAAEKRFVHYGLTKTTMNEIADDLSMSKASLYYYFADKVNLYEAVLDRLFNILLAELQLQLSKDISHEQKLMTYLNVRHAFIKKYYRLLELQKISGSEAHVILDRKFKEHHKVKEMGVLQDIIEKGKAAGEFDVEDPHKIVELMMDCTMGLRWMVLNANNNSPFPEEELFDMVIEKQHLLTEMFIKAIKAR
jgi:TetR/AcrR family transcriptional repressor of mexJK operon